MQTNPIGINADDVVLLWANPNPSGGGEAGRDVVLSESLDNFRFYFIVFAVENITAPTARIATGLIPISSPTMLQAFAFNESDIDNNPAGLPMFRTCGPLGGTSFRIGNGYYTLVNVNPVSYGGACVPKRIYGVR